jgi:hypothetical protein
MNLSQNFVLAETIRSATAKRLGITLQHTDKTLAATRALVENLLQPLRRRTGPLFNTSWLRTPELQYAIYADELAPLVKAVDDAAKKASRARSDTGKAKAAAALEQAQLQLGDKERAVLRTQHVKGEAVDIFSNRMSRDEVLVKLNKLLQMGSVDIDQCIVYAHKRRIVHLSLTQRRPNRREFLYSPEPGVYERALSLLDLVGRA